jgi:hypothetical protein
VKKSIALVGVKKDDIDFFETARDTSGLSVDPLFGEKRPGEIDRICLANTKAAKGYGLEP